jgi:hypothetical protein
VFGELFAFGRRTVTQGLLALGLGEYAWSAWYRLFSCGRFDEAAAGAVLLRASLEHGGADEPYVVGTDGVRFERSSQKMPGTGWLPALGTAAFRRGLKRAQRFVHGAWLAPLSADGYSRAFPLRQGWRKWELRVCGQLRTMRYRVEGPFVRDELPTCPGYLIVIGGTTRWVGKRHPQRKQTKPCFYLVTAVAHEGAWQLPFPITTLLARLWQRWELEVTHREMKSGLGVGEIQCWSQRGAVVSVQWSAWFFAVLLFAGYRTWGLVQGPPALGRWRRHARRWSISTLLRGFRAELWGDSEFRACWTPSPDNWADIEHWIQGRNNAVAATSRL